jgi:hypothetical protein
MEPTSYSKRKKLGGGSTPPKASSSIDRAWAESFGDAIRTKDRRPTGDGWKTRKELSEEYGSGTDKTCQAIRKLVAAGKLEVFHGFAFLHNDTRPQRQSWYRPTSLAALNCTTAAPTTSSVSR